MAKKVLIYAPTVGRGGVRRVIETLCAEFAKRRGWTFDVLGQTYDELGEWVLYPDGWNVMQIRPVDSLPDHPKQFDFLMRNRQHFFDHLKEVVSDYDMVFCPSPWWAFIGAEPVTRPVVSFVPDFAFDYLDMGMLGTYFQGIAPIIANHSRHTVFPSDFQRAKGNKYGFEGKGSTIYFSTDVTSKPLRASADNIDSVRLKHGLPKDYVLAFHAYGHKGVEIIIQAQELARRQSKYVPPLVIAGLETDLYLHKARDNEHVKDVQDTIRQCSGQIGRDVFILGAVEDDEVSLLHAGATVAVTATRSEGGLSGTILEAIRAETPILCTDLEVFRERLTDGDVSFFPVDNHGVLAMRLVEVCRRRGDMAARAEKLARQFAGYTIKQVVDEYIAVFKAVMDGK